MNLPKTMILAGALVLSHQASAQKNVAYQDSNVRISVITDGAARLEYAPDGHFFDGKSFIAVNRDYPKADYKVKNSGKKVVVSTPKMIITYIKGTGRFTDQNLSITNAGGKKAKVPFTWKPGQKDTQNLKGTYRTLDRYNGDENIDSHQKMPIEDGLLSRSGWTLIDDSEGYVFDNSDWPWVTHRPNEGKTQDLYFLAYGHDYKKALKDFSVFAGKTPLPPRYAFGYWWSRYWHYTENEYRGLVNNMHTYGIPFDVLVIDMDWHYFTEGKGGWTGYTWNRRLFPSPEGFLKWIKSEGLKSTLNLHPADGIKAYEECYPQMAKYLGMNPDEKKDIPWAASDKHFMQGWFNTVLHPMEKMGVSFWWLDWQQGLNDKEFPRLSNTWWINYCVFSDMERNRNERPMLYHRWGGLGNHRYQIGFSGDSRISWKSLDFQPYFNSTASNVLYGYWSHDIGGHEGADHIDPELYQRWMQFGMLSPILRTHATKSTVLNKEPWMFPYEVTANLRDIVNFRYRIAPYTYTMARKDHDTAVSLCRPMYYDYPESKEAYDNKNEYMFGDQMLFYPVTAPMDNGVATKKIWLPSGNDWFEVVSGTLLKGGQTVERKFQIDEYPLYVKAGSVIPEYTGKLKNLQSNNNGITLAVYPGGNGEFTMYEDNGDDKNYETEYATTQLRSVRNGNKLTVTIGARKGNYKDMPAERDFTVRLVASAVPSNVTVNGQKVDFTYDGNNLSVIINVPVKDAATEKVVEVTYPSDALDVTDGLIGKFRHIRQLNYKLIHSDAGLVFNEELGTMESTGLAIGYYPSEFNERIKLFRKNYAQLDEVLKKQGLSDEKRAEYLRKAY